MKTTLLREQFASLAHDMWSGWMAYLFTKCDRAENGGLTIRRETLARWNRQMATSYAKLPEGEKESDRDQADKMLAIIKKFEAQ